VRLGIFYPGFSSKSAALPSIFIHNLKTELNDGIAIYSDTIDGDKHWYCLAEDYAELDALIVFVDCYHGFTLSRHVSRLYPGAAVLFKNNLFEGTYKELDELSTAKVLRERFHAENPTRSQLVEALADSFERKWNPKIFSRVLGIRESVVGLASPLFLPINGAGRGVELPFPIDCSRSPSVETARPTLLVSGAASSDYYTGILDEVAGERFKILKVENSGRWYSGDSQGQIADREELLQICSASLAIDITVESGYSLGSIGALSVGAPVAGFSCGSLRDVLIDELKLSPGFNFRSTLESLLGLFTSGGEKLRVFRAEQRNRVRNNFSPSAVIKILLEAIQNEQFFNAQKKQGFRAEIFDCQRAMEGEAID
jgi:hypothetical protein